jgi:hypothetical protein
MAIQWVLADDRSHSLGQAIGIIASNMVEPLMRQGEWV